MRKPTTFLAGLLALACLFSCRSKTSETTPATPPVDTSAVANLSMYEMQGDSLIIPPFEIEVNSSAKTDQLLTKKKETIIVSAMFWSLPTDPQEKAKGEDGMVAVLNTNIELKGNQRVARFEGLKFSKNLLPQMEDKDVNLLINVYSGRRSTQDNLLDAGIVEMKASEFGNKRLVLPCKLIDEKQGATTTAGYPEACYALPEAGAASQPLRFLVECSENGAMQFAGKPVQNYEALMATLRPLLLDKLKRGTKAADLPGITTSGCMMGNSGAIQDSYNDLLASLSGKGKTGDQAKPAATPAPAPASAPGVTLKQNGDILLNGKNVGTVENLRKVLQESLLKNSVIPDKIALKTVGETGMGMRAEVNTIIAESIAGAKWLRKKSALEQLNLAVGKKLGVTTELALGTYQSSGNFAYISAKPKRADGRPLDYSKTSFAEQSTAATFVDNVIGLLRYEKGAWKVLIYNIGANKAPVDTWVKKFGAPKGVFTAR